MGFEPSSSQIFSLEHWSYGFSHTLYQEPKGSPNRYTTWTSSMLGPVNRLVLWRACRPSGCESHKPSKTSPSVKIDFCTKLSQCRVKKPSFDYRAKMIMEGLCSYPNGNETYIVPKNYNNEAWNRIVFWSRSYFLDSMGRLYSAVSVPSTLVLTVTFFIQVRFSNIRKDIL